MVVVPSGRLSIVYSNVPTNITGRWKAAGWNQTSIQHCLAADCTRICTLGQLYNVVVFIAAEISNNWYTKRLSPKLLRGSASHKKVRPWHHRIPSVSRRGSVYNTYMRRADGGLINNMIHVEGSSINSARVPHTWWSPPHPRSAGLQVRSG